jgi:serine/threonine-protein kinase HipA
MGLIESGYGITTLRRMFSGKKVSHILQYNSPHVDSGDFRENTLRISISGVHKKYSLTLEKNKLRFIGHGESGEYILKPQPSGLKNSEFMPANEHLTMQIARSAMGIETAENSIIFFEDYKPAYLVKRFDVNPKGGKWAVEDFASITERTPATHGIHYKYKGSYLEMFEAMKRLVPAYTIEAIKLFRLIAFNFLFSNGDAHFKNFSLLETPLGDFRLSPAYDLVNTKLHISDSDFALEDGLLPKSQGGGSIKMQFLKLAQLAGIPQKLAEQTLVDLTSKSLQVEEAIASSMLNEKCKKNYLQSYQRKLNKLV